MQISPVTMPPSSPRTAAPPSLPPYIKDSLKEDRRLFALDFLLEAFAFWVKGGF
jgi:hypothetical protein